jgi:ABC-type multidrug transport system ATPase subunit
LSETPAGAAVGVDALVVRAGRTALSQVSLSWTAGAHAILGARDDGGPLLLAAIAGRVRVRSGQVRVLGQSAGHPQVRPQVGYVPLDATLPDALRVDEALAVASELRQEPVQDAGARLGALGLDALARRPVRSLLASEARAIALAEAVTSTRVRVILVEEPFAVMDARAAGRIAERLRARADAGDVVVVATASVGDAGDVAEDHALLRRGTLVRRGASQDMLAGFWLDGNNARLRIVLKRPDDARALAGALARQADVVGIERLAGAVCARGRDAAALARAAGRAAVEVGVDIAELRFDPPSLDEAQARPSPAAGGPGA